MQSNRSVPSSISADGAVRASLLRVAGVALIVALVSIAYFPSLDGELILDDRLNLIENPLIRAPDGPYRFWLTTEPIDYWPVFNTMLWLEWRLWGSNPFGYRVTNLALHIMSVLLIWLILARLAIPGAFLAAVLFAVHPVNVESVAWITQLKNLLALFFSLGSVVLYLSSLRRQSANDPDRSNLSYVGSVVLFALAVLSKGSAAIVPMILFGILLWRGPLRRKDLARLVPFFAVSAVLVPINIWFQSRLDTQIPATGWLERLLTAPAVAWFYLGKAVVPLDLAFVYPRWHVTASQVVWWLPLLAAVGVTALLWRYRERWGRPLLFAWGFFGVSLAPVLGFTDIAYMEHSLVADHYQHFALIGVMALLAAAWSSWRQRSRGLVEWVANGAAVTVVATFALLTWQQSGLYVDGETLYRDTLEKNPGSWMIHNNLGALLNTTGRHEEAIRHLDDAIRLKPDYADAHNNLGNALREVGRLDEAIERHEQAAELKRPFPTAHYNLGIALAEAGDPSGAIQQYREVLRLQPDHVDARLNLGNVLADTGQLEEAIQEYERILQRAPDFAEAYFNLGIALSQAGRTEEAVAPYREALRRIPDSPRIHHRLGIALIPSQPNEAISHLRRAVSLQPDYALAHNDLGVALVGVGRLTEAFEHFEEALRLQPHLPDARYNLEVTRKMAEAKTSSSETPDNDQSSAPRQ